MTQSTPRMRGGVVRGVRSVAMRAARGGGRSRLGVSLVEILVAIVVFALGLIAAANALQRGVSSVSEKTGARIAELATSAHPDSRELPTLPAQEQAAPPAAPEPEPAADDGGGFWGKAWDITKKAGGFVVDNFTPVGDIKTLFDPNASVFDKVLAGTSLVASVVPIPGVGPGVKGLTKLAKFGAKHADDVKAAERGVQVARDADRGRDAARAADEVEPPDLAAGRRKPDEPEPDCQGGACRREGESCFAAGTLVFTEHGDRPIEAVMSGDRVWSRDPVTGALALKPVVRTFVHDALVIDLELDSPTHAEHLTVTAEHPFWAESRGWVPAAELENTVDLWSPAGALTGHAMATLSRVTKVYNFEVADSHTYFVGELHAWVHNDCWEVDDDTLDELHDQYGPEVAEGVRYNAERFSEGAEGHALHGVGTDPHRLAEYFSRDHDFAFLDAETGKEIAYDEINQILIIREPGRVHGYNYTPDEWNARVDSERFRPRSR